MLNLKSKQEINKNIYFFLGTEAELIKTFPVIKELKKRRIKFKIIASGQNNILNSKILKYLEIPKVDLILSDENIKQTPVSLLTWFVKTLIKSFLILNKEFNNLDKKNTYLFIHGDTVSTVMGAILGKFFNLNVAHIEAGLRSFNFFSPFPEEIDRVIASRLSDIHFCPNDWSIKNLKNTNGLKVNTLQNTLFDSLEIALKDKSNDEFNKIMKIINKNKYFIFVYHRQENLINERLLRELISQIIKISKNKKCIFVIHKPTEKALLKLGLNKQLQNNKNILMLPRVEYFTFMKLLNKSEYIITDGGSNQEESYYFGKPCLILRKVTERQEGLGENVLLMKNDISKIDYFVNNYTKYIKPKITLKKSPSGIIASYIINI